MIKVAIDAGHGYNTAGKRTPKFNKTVTHEYNGQKVTTVKGDQVREHVANVGVAYYLDKELTRCGVKVIRVGWNDINALDDIAPTNPTDDVIARQKVVKANSCDYSISCHFNASGDGVFNSAKGIETLIHADSAKAKDSRKLAELVQKNLVGVYSQSNRGVKTSPSLGMCNCVGLNVKSAILIEFAFMTNEEEAMNYICNPNAWHNYAVAVAKAFCSYINIPYVSESKSNTNNNNSTDTTTKPFSQYVVRVNAGLLNIRTGPGTNFDKNGTITNRGAYTIVAESTGAGAKKWGKLKSGAGWISLDFCERV